MQPLTLNGAAKACKKSKSAILEDIRSGRLSASKDDNNQWQIQPSELFRVYPPTQSATEQQNHDRPPTENHPTPLLLMLEKERDERDRERKQLQATIDDLRHRLDEESVERRKLTALITHQPTELPEQKPEPEQPKSLLWKKLFGRVSHDN
jgi:hypothetical protein